MRRRQGILKICCLLLIAKSRLETPHSLTSTQCVWRARKEKGGPQKTDNPWKNEKMSESILIHSFHTHLLWDENRGLELPVSPQTILSDLIWCPFTLSSFFPFTHRIRLEDTESGITEPLELQEFESKQKLTKIMRLLFIDSRRHIKVVRDERESQPTFRFSVT